MQNYREPKEWAKSVLMNGRLIFRAVVLSVLLLLPSTGLKAQPYTNIHSFSAAFIPAGGGVQTNSDGASPQSGLAASGALLFGTASTGGANGYGTLFRVDVDGGNFATLKSFSASEGISSACTPAVTNGFVYGATALGAGQAGGVVFKITTDGAGYTALRTLSSAVDGAAVIALAVAGNNLFGVANDGGAKGAGTLFRMGLDGSDFTVLWTFGGVYDGKAPNSLCVLGNTLYGSTSRGGSNSWGTVFSINTDGSGYRVLKSFDRATTGDTPLGLTAASGAIYGAFTSGSTGLGGIFKLSLDGSAYSSIKSFTSLSDPLGVTGGLALQGDTLYGASAAGGALGFGSLFKLATSGTGFTILYSFSNTVVSGCQPLGNVTLSGAGLFGTTISSGRNNVGVVYKWGLAPVTNSLPPLTVNSTGIINGNFILQFPTQLGRTYSIERNTNFGGGIWMILTNITGSGGALSLPMPVGEVPAAFFRVRQQ